MKYIRNVTVLLSKGTHRLASAARIAVVGTSGVYTTTANFLCGENPWGLHQDFIFSAPLSNVRAGERICAAALKALEKNLENIEVSCEDYALLINALAFPRPSAESPMHPALARDTLKAIASIELGASEPFEKEEEEEEEEAPRFSTVFN